ncbi:MAG: thermonuclease family protein [Pseudomonadota bacterium]
MTSNTFIAPMVVVFAIATFAGTFYGLLATRKALADATITVPASKIYVHDGDTVEFAGTSYRLIGFDAPETYRAKCPAEYALGQKAGRRLRQLIDENGSIELEVKPRVDHYGRKLAFGRVDAGSIGLILIREDLARPYFFGSRAPWCPPAFLNFYGVLN